eukprot:c16226_g1_i1.p1 GENE.c16226_g1_i1~~c16226_g1_i1.p1  ORF type:complete len:135 (-),score=40.19 c16226_g1_i1:70-474(-)
MRVFYFTLLLICFLSFLGYSSCQENNVVENNIQNEEILSKAKQEEKHEIIETTELTQHSSNPIFGGRVIPLDPLHSFFANGPVTLMAILALMQLPLLNPLINILYYLWQLIRLHDPFLYGCWPFCSRKFSPLTS